MATDAVLGVDLGHVAPDEVMLPQIRPICQVQECLPGAAAAVTGAVSPTDGPRGVAARNWPTGGGAAWGALLFAAALVIYYW